MRRHVPTTTESAARACYDKPAVVGAKVHASCHRSADWKTVDLAGATPVNGGGVDRGLLQFRGKKYSGTTTNTSEVQVDSSGRLDASFTLPEDYGGVHECARAGDGQGSCPERYR